MTRFTEPVRETLRVAHSFASEFVGTEHLLLALAQVPGVAASVLANEGIDVERLTAAVTTGSGGRSGSIPFSLGAKRSLEQALGKALDRGANDIGTAHLLLALLSTDTETAAALALATAGWTPSAVCRAVDDALLAGERDDGT